MRSSREPGARARASALSAWATGWSRTLRAPAIPLGLLLLTLALTLPLGAVMHERIAADLGASGVAADLVDGWHADWAAEFARDATGVERTLSHVVIGFGGSLAIVSHVLDRAPMPPALAILVLLQWLIWQGVWGGILDRYAGPRRGGPVGFLAGSGAYAFRFFRLAVGLGLVWWLIAGWVHPWIFETAYPALIRDVTSEWTAASIRIAGYLLVLGLVAGVVVTADLARARTVVEDRRSMLGAVAAALRLARRRPAGVALLAVLNLLALGAVLGAWAVVAPGIGTPAVGAFVAAQVYLFARLLVRLSLAASFVAFVQAEFPPFGAAPLPEPVWPDAPSARDDLL